MDDRDRDNNLLACLLGSRDKIYALVEGITQIFLAWVCIAELEGNDYQGVVCVPMRLPGRHAGLFAFQTMHCDNVTETFITSSQCNGKHLFYTFPHSYPSRIAHPDAECPFDAE